MMAVAQRMADRTETRQFPRAVAGLLALLRHDHEAAELEVVQTHISWIVLAGSYAYKIKKPVELGFLDYSTLEKRLRACQREVELNRRLCPTVYLGVLSLAEHDGQIVIGDAPEGGEVLDYMVWMRHLPHDLMLDQLLARGEATAAQLELVAERLASFHASAATGPGVDEHGEPEAVAANVEQNFEQVKPHVGRTIDRESFTLIAMASRNFLTRRRALFERRVAEGRIRDGHGDLHAASICLTSPLAIFDCIEFNDRYRCGDVAAEVAFLAMDLEFNRRSDLARAFVDRYVAASGDQELLELLDFYIVYRAYVRGKVESIKLSEPEFGQAERARAVDRAWRYFAIARRYAERLAEAAEKR
jgi:aminoglycoside phosphotransferase family enzyme